MENTFFKMIGQKSGDGKIVLIAVVDERFLNQKTIPNIFEIQCMKTAPTIYSGTYPTIKMNLGTMEDREDLKGTGIAGILTGESWYCMKRKFNDQFGIGLKNP